MTSPTARATPEQRRRAREMRGDGFSLKDIARRFGLSVAQVRPMVRDVRRGEGMGDAVMTHDNTHPRRRPRRSTHGAAAGWLRRRRGS